MNLKLKALIAAKNVAKKTVINLLKAEIKLSLYQLETPEEKVKCLNDLKVKTIQTTNNEELRQELITVIDEYIAKVIDNDK